MGVFLGGCLFAHRVFQERASCTCASLSHIYLYIPLQVCVTVQGCVGLCVCGLGWVEMAGCDQPLPLLMLFQARLKITQLPLPAETKVLPREFTPPASTLLASRRLLPSTAASTHCLCGSPVFSMWSWERGGVRKSCFHCPPLPQGTMARHGIASLPSPSHYQPSSQQLCLPNPFFSNLGTTWEYLALLTSLPLTTTSHTSFPPTNFRACLGCPLHEEACCLHI